MRFIFTILIILLIAIPSFALDKKFGASNSFMLVITDLAGNGMTGLTIPSADLILKVKCGSGSTVTVDETGDTLTEIGGGAYYLTTNDNLSFFPEIECIAWAEGQTSGIYEGYIAFTPRLDKAVNNTTSTTTCDISASTSGTSFTIASCTDEDGASITLATDMFVGMYAVAYTNGASRCNVGGEGVFINDLTAGVVTVKETDMPGSGFSATPNTTNCGVRMSPND